MKELMFLKIMKISIQNFLVFLFYINKGHDYADYFLMNNFIYGLLFDENTLSGPDETLNSHLITFACGIFYFFIKRGIKN
jgi:hypothetical protein